MATITYTVTVASGTNQYGTGNKFYINGEVSPVLYLQEGNTYIFDLSETEFLDLMRFARIVALGIKKAIDCSRVAISVVGLEINHTHIHLIPIKSEKDVNFEFKVSFSEEEMDKIAKKISDSISY